MSALVDAKREQDLRRDSSADASYMAHLSLQQLCGAGAWLTAPPADAARTIEPALFKMALRRRLRIRVQDADMFCPMCGGTMDSYGDHALVCPCSGDRTVRHNRLRDSVFEDALRGHMGPEREKPGLLPERPRDDGTPPSSGGWDGRPRALQGPGDALPMSSSLELWAGHLLPWTSLARRVCAQMCCETLRRTQTLS